MRCRLEDEVLLEADTQMPVLESASCLVVVVVPGLVEVKQLVLRKLAAVANAQAVAAVLHKLASDSLVGIVLARILSHLDPSAARARTHTSTDRIPVRPATCLVMLLSVSCQRQAQLRARETIGSWFRPS